MQPSVNDWLTATAVASLPTRSGSGRMTGSNKEKSMSASHTSVRVRWGLPIFGLALVLAALLGPIAIPYAGAAPLPPATAAPPTAFNRGPASPAITSAAHRPSVNAEALTHTTAAYRPLTIPAAPIRPAADTPFARANTGFDSVDGYYGPNADVRFTVTRGAEEIGGNTGKANADGWMNGIGCGCDMQPGDVVTVDSGSFHAVLHPIPITGAIDVLNDVVSGQMAGVSSGNGNVEVWSKATDEWHSVDITIGAGGNYLANFALREPPINIQTGDRAQVWYIDANNNWVGDVLYTPYLQVRANQSHDWVQGEATPQTNVKVKVMRNGTEIGYGESFTGGGTGWNVNPRQPDGANVDMRAGDIVDVTAGALSASVELIDMDGAVNATTNVVSGKLVGKPNADVRVEVWRDNGGDGRDLKTDAQGNFSIDFDNGVPFDIRQGDNVGIWYVRPDGNMVGIVRSDFRIEVELRDNDLWGMATPKSRVDLEVRTSGTPGTLKGKFTAWTDQEGNYGTDIRDANGQRVDIQAGDVVKGACGAKLTILTIPTPFDAAYNYNTHTVCGHAPAGAQLRVDLWGYGTQTPTAAGNTEYCATFGDDTKIETEGESQLDLSSGHSVLYRFRTPTPMLWLNKWSDGQPPSGGYHRYTLRVGNFERADITASGATLVDTLPAGMTYVSASPPKSDQTDNKVIWNLADLAPGTERDITLTVLVDDTILDPGDEVENCAEVKAAGWEIDTGDNKSCDKRTVTENLADLAIGGGVMPGDPAPGQEYIYRIDYGNKRPAGSRNVEIIDTLPSGTTYVSEWHPDGWTRDTTQAGKIIWRTAYLPGQNGGYLELKLRVNGSATPGAQLHNSVEIKGDAPDADSNSNVWENDAGVQEPYGNVLVDKGYSYAIPVAGYEYATWLHVWNQGNVPATGVVLNDTLPAGATFVRATQYTLNETTGNYDGTDAPPAAQGTGWVRWNVPALPTWRDFWIEVTFRIGASTAPGTELVNKADVTLTGDQDPNNNHAEYKFRTQAPGPNLRVTKWYEWGEVEPGGTVQYQLRFENDGTAPLYDLVFEDILPDHVTLNDVGWKWNDQPKQNGKTLTWTPNWQLNPGDQNGFWLQVRVDDGTPAGTILTNTAQGSSSTTEVLNTDNTAEVTLAVGPDLRVEKELLTQWVRPGDRMRYRIHVWNDGHAWARNAILTDILPAGMTFVRSDRGGKDTGNNTIVWDTRDLPPGWSDEFDMEVDVAPGLAVGSSLTNLLKITSDGGDAYPDDNDFELTSYVPFKIRLPLILKGK
jgi:uncharacterized repeat protein (TIGR01451 family)